MSYISGILKIRVKLGHEFDDDILKQNDARYKAIVAKTKRLLTIE